MVMSITESFEYQYIAKICVFILTKQIKQDN